MKQSYKEQLLSPLSARPQPRLPDFHKQLSSTSTQLRTIDTQVASTKETPHGKWGVLIAIISTQALRASV